MGFIYFSEDLLKMIKNNFYFTLKAPFFLETFKKLLAKKAKVNFKIY